ncbi:MAG: hypothetical protein QME75_14565 [Deltaproteobacteria bacterium]|nr:hypothetical protein [Deltaproteobacteria bacterium]
MNPKHCGRVMAKFKWCLRVMLPFLICIMLLNNLAIGAEKHWIADKSDDGSIIILEDGSVWQVDPVDRVDSMLWLPTEDIIIPDSYDCLINTDNGEKVDAIRIR